MRTILLISLTLLVTGCSQLQTRTQLTTTPPARPTQAVYLTTEGGILSNSELQNHPEVTVVSSMEDFKAAADVKSGLWIDKNAVDLLAAEIEWLHRPPQKYYPLILVGYNDPLYAFREAISGFGIEGPAIDWSSATLEPGFSVWMITEELGGVKSVFRGYEEVPTVERLLEVTNELIPQSLAR
jgi:hypothetical protein